MPETEVLTPIQRKVFEYLVGHVEERGYQPTITEMAEHFEVDKRAVLDTLYRLEEAGFVKLPESRKDRAISFPGVKFLWYRVGGEGDPKRKR